MPENTHKPQILLVDDEPTTLKIVSRVLSEKYDVFSANSAAEALELISKNDRICVAVCDQRMPGDKGVDFFARLREAKPRIVRIIATAYSDYDILVKSINEAGVFAYFDKPFNFDIVLSVLANAVLSYEASAGADSDSLQISTRDLFIKNEIDLDFDDLSVLESLFRVIGAIKSRNGSLSVKMARIGEETVVTLIDTNREITEHLLLSQFRSFLEGSLSFDGPISSSLQLIDAPREVIKNLPSKDELELREVKSARRSIGPVTASRLLSHHKYQIKNNLDQLQVFLNYLVNLSDLPIRNKPSTGKAYLSALDLRDRCRKASFSDKEIVPMAAELLGLMMNFLDGINQEGAPEREYVKKLKADYRTINGLFTNYNSLASIMEGTIVHPDKSIAVALEPKESSFDKILLSAVIIGVIIALIAGVVFIPWDKEMSNFYGPLIKYSYVVGLALVSGIVVSKFVGKASVEGHLDFLGMSKKPVLAKATGGFSVFIILLWLGAKFVLVK